MDMVSGNVDFTSEDLVEHLQKQQILARELKGVKPEKLKKFTGVEANELTTGNAKAIGICYDFQSEEGCLRKNCRFRHEELPTNPKSEAKQNAGKPHPKHVSMSGKCRRTPGGRMPRKENVDVLILWKEGALR